VSIYNVKKFPGASPPDSIDKEGTEGKGGEGGRERKGREQNKGKETAFLCPRKKK
jgi:hypothetical protein